MQNEWQYITLYTTKTTYFFWIGIVFFKVEILHDTSEPEGDD